MLWHKVQYRPGKASTPTTLFRRVWPFQNDSTPVLLQTAAQQQIIVFPGKHPLRRWGLESPAMKFPFHLIKTMKLILVVLTSHLTRFPSVQHVVQLTPHRQKGTNLVDFIFWSSTNFIHVTCYSYEVNFTTMMVNLSIQAIKDLLNSIKWLS